MSIDMSGGISGSYMTPINNRVNAIIKEIEGLGEYVRGIWQKSADENNEADKSAAKVMLKKAEERIERLRAQIKNMGPALDQTITKIEQQIEDLKKQLQIG